MLEQMKLDFANVQLQMLKPHLQATSVEYEREKFQQLLESSHSQRLDTTMSQTVLDVVDCAVCRQFECYEGLAHGCRC